MKPLTLSADVFVGATECCDMNILYADKMQILLEGALSTARDAGAFSSSCAHRHLICTQFALNFTPASEVELHSYQYAGPARSLLGRGAEAILFRWIQTRSTTRNRLSVRGSATTAQPARIQVWRRGVN